MLTGQNLSGQNMSILVILLKVTLQNSIYHSLFEIKLKKYSDSGQLDSGQSDSGNTIFL